MGGGGRHHKQFMLYDMETALGQMNKSRILDFLRFFCAIERIYRYSIVFMIGWITFFKDGLTKSNLGSY